MNNITVLTCGDSNYYKFLKRFEVNIYEMFGTYPIIYDLGLTPEQVNALNSKVVKVDVIDNFQEYNSLGFIQATHKPYCILDFLNNNVESCLYLDADILLGRKVLKEDLWFEQFDCAVTPRHEDERYEKLLKNGYINSGFMFFKNNSLAKKLVSDWIEKCQEENTTDQLAFSDLLMNSKVDIFGERVLKINEANLALLDAKRYNDVSLKSGLVLHYKNAARFEAMYKRYKFDFFMIGKRINLRYLYSFFIRVKARFR